MITRIPTKTRMLEKIPFNQPKTYSKVIIKNYKKQLGFRLYCNDDTFRLKEERSVAQDNRTYLNYGRRT